MKLSGSMFILGTISTISSSAMNSTWCEMLKSITSLQTANEETIYKQRGGEDPLGSTRYFDWTNLKPKIVNQTKFQPDSSHERCGVCLLCFLKESKLFCVNDFSRHDYIHTANCCFKFSNRESWYKWNSWETIQRMMWVNETDQSKNGAFRSFHRYLSEGKDSDSG